jgi:signal transduction histidine kinase
MGGVVRGAIIVTSDQAERSFVAAEVRLAETVAGQLAGAIERARLFELAEQARATAEAASGAKSRFLATMSHELRTPLNGILGYAQLLQRDDQLLPQQHEALRVIEQSGNHLLALITHLLDLAKIEAGKMEIRSEPLVVGDMFEGLVNILRPLTEQKALTIAPFVAPDVPILQTDPGKLQQVLYNFLSNAIKFSVQGGRIELVATRDGAEHVRIAVTDHGPGIAAEKQSIIFEKFRQLDGSVTRTHSGTGLGLAISRELSILLSGSIGVKSAPGEGATFWITVPLRIQPGEMEVTRRLVMS